MKKRFILLLAVIFLFGCSANDFPAETPSASDAGTESEVLASQATTEETRPAEATTAPTEETAPPHMDFGTLDASAFLPYDEYFGEYRAYETGTNLIPYLTWHFENAEYRLEEKSAHLVVMDQSNQVVHQILKLSDYPNCIWAAVDGYWIYGVRDETELFRIDMNGENEEVLFHDGMRSVSTFLRQIAIGDHCTLFFWAKDEESTTIYRLYIPEMRLDVLYEGDAEDVFLSWIISNNELVWAETNPEFTALVESLTTDPESKYYGMHQTDMISDEYKIPREYQHYINTLTGENYSVAMYSSYSERSPENIQNNGMQWWKDFQ